MESVILEEDIDDNYEPTTAEIDEYAQWLGMTEEDQDLMWIAREGLKAPLPEHWKPCKTNVCWRAR
jgi:centrosomal protein CEP164